MAKTKKSEKGTTIHEPSGATGGTQRGGHAEMNQAAPEAIASAEPLKATLGDLIAPTASELEHINAQTTGSASIFSFRPAMNRKTTMAAALSVLGVGALAYFLSTSRSRKAA